MSHAVTFAYLRIDKINNSTKVLLVCLMTYRKVLLFSVTWSDLQDGFTYCKF